MNLSEAQLYDLFNSGNADSSLLKELARRIARIESEFLICRAITVKTWTKCQRADKWHLLKADSNTTLCGKDTSTWDIVEMKNPNRDIVCMACLNKIVKETI